MWHWSSFDIHFKWYMRMAMANFPKCFFELSSERKACNSIFIKTVWCVFKGSLCSDCCVFLCTSASYFPDCILIDTFCWRPVWRNVTVMSVLWGGGDAPVDCNSGLMSRPALLLCVFCIFPTVSVNVPVTFSSVRLRQQTSEPIRNVKLKCLI